MADKVTIVNEEKRKCNKCGELRGVETEYYKSDKKKCKSCWKEHFAKLKPKKTSKIENDTKSV